MRKIINIKSKDAVNDLNLFKNKHYYSLDIRFDNVHLCELNKKVRKKIFQKNNLFINSTTLYEIMQPLGLSGSHNYHGLLAEDILNALNSLIDPKFILVSKNNRYLIIPTKISSFGISLMVVIETGAGLVDDRKACINKIVTIYPKSDIDEFLMKFNIKDILFIKK